MLSSLAGSVNKEEVGLRNENLHADEAINSDICQGGEHRMSIHNVGFDLASDNIAKHNIISIVTINDDDKKIIFDGTYTRRERRTLISIGIYDDTSGSIVPVHHRV